jgi:hypothetical protein
MCWFRTSTVKKKTDFFPRNFNRVLVNQHATSYLYFLSSSSESILNILNYPESYNKGYEALERLQSRDIGSSNLLNRCECTGSMGFDLRTWLEATSASWIRYFTIHECHNKPHM